MKADTIQALKPSFLFVSNMTGVGRNLLWDVVSGDTLFLRIKLSFTLKRGLYFISAGNERVGCTLSLPVLSLAFITEVICILIWSLNLRLIELNWETHWHGFLTFQRPASTEGEESVKMWRVVGSTPAEISPGGKHRLLKCQLLTSFCFKLPAEAAH